MTIPRSPGSSKFAPVSTVLPRQSRALPGCHVTANASTSCGSLLRRGDIACDLSSFSSPAFTCHPVGFSLVFDSMMAAPKIRRFLV